MPKIISEESEKQVIGAYITGLSRDYTSNKYSVSAGKVSKLWSEFEELIGPEGRALRDLGIQLRKQKLTKKEPIENIFEGTHLVMIKKGTRPISAPVHEDRV